MSHFSDQLSQTRKSQAEAQIEFFRSFSSKAVERTEKAVALHLSASRASMEKSTAAIQQLLQAKDPRDLFSLATHTQENFQNLLAYGRALLGIVTGAAQAAVAPAAVKPAVAALPQLKTGLAVGDAVEEEVKAEVKAEIKAASSMALTPETLAPLPPLSAVVAAPSAPLAAPDPAPAPPVDAAPAPALPPAAAPVPAAKAKPLAKAVSKTVVPEPVSKPAAAPFPVAKPRGVAVSGVKAVHAAPPPAPVSGKPAGLAKLPQAGGAKARKK